MDHLPVDQIMRIMRSYGATRVRVFGSRARGGGAPDSDLDLIVDVPSGTTLFDLAGIRQELKELLEIEVEIFTESSLHPQLKDRILAEARPLVAALGSPAFSSKISTPQSIGSSLPCPGGQSS